MTFILFVKKNTKVYFVKCMKKEIYIISRYNRIRNEEVKESLE